MREFKVYLAGPISGLTYDEGQDWRSYSKSILAPTGIKGYSPLRAKEFIRKSGILRDGAYDQQHPLSSDRGIITRDRNDVLTCDLMLVNLIGAKEVSVGTSIELGWADAFRKPVVCAIEHYGNPHEHPMVRELLGYRVSDLDEALGIVQQVLLEGNLQ